MDSYFIFRLLGDFNVLKVSKTHLEESYRRLRGRALLLKTFTYNLPDVVDEEFYFRQWDLIQQRAKESITLLIHSDMVVIGKIYRKCKRFSCMVYRVC